MRESHEDLSPSPVALVECLPSLRRRACDEQVASGGSLVGRDASDPLADHRHRGSGVFGRSLPRRLRGRQLDAEPGWPARDAGEPHRRADGPSLCPGPTIPDAGASRRLTFTAVYPRRAGRSPMPHQRQRSLISPEAETPAGASARATVPAPGPRPSTALRMRASEKVPEPFSRPHGERVEPRGRRGTNAPPFRSSLPLVGRVAELGAKGP